MISSVKPDKESCMLLDMQYAKPDRKNGIPDYLYIIWKDLVLDEKHLEVIPEPEMDIYFEKEEYRNHTYNKNYAHLDTLTKKTVKYKDIPFAIAEEIGEGGKKFLNDVFNSKDYGRIKELLLYPYVFGADYDAVAFNRVKWLRELNNDLPKKLKKGFLDIEVDGLEVNTMPNPETCPINAVTLIDDSTHISYTFILTDREFVEKTYPVSGLYKESKKENDAKLEWGRHQMYKHMWEEQHKMMENTSDFVKELHDAFDESYGEMDYKLYFYKDERKMLVHLFQLINSLKLDFIGIWNISFDIPYIINRIRALGMDPANIMCHPDFPTKICRFKEDTRNHDIKNKSDYFFLSSYTIFYDQMELYASIRKGASELRSYRLNDIGKAELRDTKLDYSEDGDIKTLPYKNFFKFIMYNIKDVLLQVGIERKTSDFDTLYITSFDNATPYDKVFKKTVALRNVEYYSFLNQNLIPGSNVNAFTIREEEVKESSDDEDDDEDDSFEGALVADPKYNGYVGLKLFGRPSNCIFGNAIDFDMSAFYPSSIRAMNIDPSTLIFKMILLADQFNTSTTNGELPFRGITDGTFEKNQDVGKECIDNFQTGNYLSSATKWLGLPDIYEIYERYMKEVAKQ